MMSYGSLLNYNPKAKLLTHNIMTFQKFNPNKKIQEKRGISGKILLSLIEI